MFRNLSPVQKSGTFAALVLLLALALSLTPLANGFTYMMVPTVTTLVMMFVITGEGYTREGWRSLGLHRAGLRQWPYALLVPFLINGIGFGVILLTGLASYGLDPAVAAKLGGMPMVVAVLIDLAVAVVTGSLGEELGWRGYLLPRLRPMGEGKALFLGGILWGVWHLPLMINTAEYHSSMNPWTYYPLFILTVIVISFAIGYTRLRTESVWPAAIMHAAANAAWNTYHLYYTSTSPLTDYVTGDAGIVQLVLYGGVAIWVVRQIKGAQPASQSRGLGQAGSREGVAPRK